ncbi:MAG: methyltransferase domain-containing protein [Candidatus Rokubacteria bacterium]|nr:methyltransferase domain-containing protein [Candidatus Rokubacteria bacterium]
MGRPIELELVEGSGARMPIRRAIERLIAVGYGLTYDAVVRGFDPYEALLDEITALIEASRPAGASRRSTRVLDISCGIGNVAVRLAREGYGVVGLDAVEHLVDVARQKSRAEVGLDLTFRHLDLARDPLPETGTFDVLVSMHTLYWHPDPARLLDACSRALRPGGHALFLTYSRPARVLRTFCEIRAREGTGRALQALRWLVPTALFEMLRHCDQRYLTEAQFHGDLARAGFEIVEARRTFLAQISLLAWTRARARGMARA